MVSTIWKTLQEYPFFKVSNTGRVIKLNKGVWEECNTYTNKKGYVFVNIRNARGEWQGIGIHRLVAMAFVKKPISNEKLCVNHLDENPSNNRADNLEYCTQGENVMYSARRKFMEYKKRKGTPTYPNPGPSVNQYTLDGKFVKTWASVKEVALTLCVPYSRILLSAICDPRYKSPVVGYWWTRAKEELPKLVLEHKTNWQLANKGC